MEKFISCDWGTSALRLRVIDNDEMKVLSETTSNEGISIIFKKWKQSGTGEDKRLAFYESVLAGQFSKLEEQLNLSLQQTPLIISGMASSSIGIMELPYKETPVNVNGHDLNIKVIEPEEDFKHAILIISGVKTNNDVMRGEETQLIGCLEDDDMEDHLFLFPGTHSKHVGVKNGKVVDIKTYMTGEFFELLTQKSILSNDIEDIPELINENNLKIFEQGVADSRHSNILHDSFRIRTNHLFGKLSKQQNYWYLSGLLTGTELNGLVDTTVPITVVGDELRIKLYGTALQTIGIADSKRLNTGKVMLKGHSKLYNLYKSKLTT